MVKYFLEVPVNKKHTISVSELRTAINATWGNQTQAARALGIPRSTLIYLLKREGLLLDAKRLRARVALQMLEGEGEG